MSGNELHRAASPYLLQHRDNPVHWKEWNEAALGLAKADHKPILLSIGYAACHWCHVMAHESFEDPATAEVMNALFVNIKVDREERPDVDHLYMSALQALGQQGGWPLTMFLTPEGEPFWGGTYFPRQARFGRPAFTTVLQSVAAAFHDRPQTIRTNTTALLGAIGAKAQPVADAPGLDRQGLDRASYQAAAVMDPIQGGTRGAPKFPNASLIEMLFRAGARLDDRAITDLALLTLRRIAEGGIYDHLGGGFARYSVDERWLVPHFEKMLYDNAQLIELLGLAWRLTGEALFKTRIAETIGWLDREMTAQGAFCASLDADSDHVEGKFYVWTQAEIEAVLGPEDAALFCRCYDVTEAGNWHDEQSGAAVSILNRLDTPVPTQADDLRLAVCRATLLRARAARMRPGLDDKVLTDWNGLAIQALARASLLCGVPEWLSLAETRFAAVVGLMSMPGQDGGLIHARRGERRGAAGFASDYAAMASAALTLQEATTARVERPDYLGHARIWLDILARHYAGPDGVLFMTADRDRDIPLRLAPLADEATPNANGVHAAALLRMAAATGDDRFRERAYRLFEAAGPAMLRSPLGHCALFNAFDLAEGGVAIVLAGPDITALAEAALRVPYLNRTVTTAAAHGPSPVALAQTRGAGEGAAFICRGQSCSAPLREPALLEAGLAGRST